MPTNMTWAVPGKAATSAKLNLPEGIFVDYKGILYIADVINNRIRMVTGLPGSTK